MSLLKQAVGEFVDSIRIGHKLKTEKLKQYGKAKYSQVNEATGGYLDAALTKKGRADHGLIDRGAPIARRKGQNDIKMTGVLKYLKSSSGISLSKSERSQILQALKHRNTLIHQVGKPTDATRAAIKKAEVDVVAITKKMKSRANKRLATTGGLAATKAGLGYAIFSGDSKNGKG